MAKKQNKLCQNKLNYYFRCQIHSSFSHFIMICYICTPKQVSVKGNWFPCIIFGEKIIVWKDVFFRFVKDSDVYVKHGRPFQKQHGKLARKRCLFICFMTLLFSRPVLFVKHLYFIVYYFISIPIFLLITFKKRECHHSKG